jgi:hypothetical protein
MRELVNVCEKHAPERCLIVASWHSSDEVTNVGEGRWLASTPH